MRRQKKNITIAGGGLSGLMMAHCLLSDARFRENFTFTLITPHALKALSALDDGFDSRTTAIMHSYQPMLKKIGLWSSLESVAAPLKIMRLIANRKAVNFHADEIGCEQFAWNIPNQSLKNLLIKNCQAAIKAKHLNVIQAKIESVRQQQDYIDIMHDGQDTPHQAHLVIAADGKQSAVRQALGIKKKLIKAPFSQWVFIARLQHAKPHQYISTEHHRQFGPLTFVPLHDAYQSALVWCDTQSTLQDVFQQYQAGHTQELADCLSIMTDNCLGEITAVKDGQLGGTLESFYAEKLHACNATLIGEAAHAIPPLGAQGFNLSLGDIATLHQKLSAGHQLGLDIADANFLRDYDLERSQEIRLRVRAVSTLNHQLYRHKSLIGYAPHIIDYLPNMLRHPLMLRGMHIGMYQQQQKTA